MYIIDPICNVPEYPQSVKGAMQAPEAPLQSTVENPNDISKQTLVGVRVGVMVGVGVGVGVGQ